MTQDPGPRTRVPHPNDHVPLLNMAGLYGDLFPARETLKEPLVNKRDKDGVELDERKAGNSGEMNGTNIGGKDAVKSQPDENNISSITDTGEHKPW